MSAVCSTLCPESCLTSGPTRGTCQHNEASILAPVAVFSCWVLPAQYTGLVFQPYSASCASSLLQIRLEQRPAPHWCREAKGSADSSMRTLPPCNPTHGPSPTCLRPKIRLRQFSYRCLLLFATCLSCLDTSCRSADLYAIILASFGLVCAALPSSNSFPNFFSRRGQSTPPAPRVPPSSACPDQGHAVRSATGNCKHLFFCARARRQQTRATMHWSGC